MQAHHSSLARVAGAVFTALVTFTACREAEAPLAPPDQADMARSPGTLTVSSVVPDKSQPGVTLDITVNGSGFVKGSVVKLERNGVPAGNITTNSTVYVTSKKLIANVTIAAAADTGKYDVAVSTMDGRKGVGIELFTVAYVIDELGMLGGTWSIAYDVNDRGEVVGESCTQNCLASAFYWTDAGGLEDLGTLPGFTRSAAYSINERGQVFGIVHCPMSDPGCGGVYQRQSVRWDKVGGSWTITRLDGCTYFNPWDFPVNNRDQCVGRAGNGQLTVLTLSGGTVINSEALPTLEPGGAQWATAISDSPMVTGWAAGAGSTHPVVWYRRSTGSWAVLQLGLVGSDNLGRSTDVSEPDASGRVKVTGWTATSNSGHAVRWTLEPDGLGGWRVASTESLAKPRGGGSSPTPEAVNSNGDVVGHYASQPVLWPAAGGVGTLPMSGAGGSGRALGINSQGWIVGTVWDNTNSCDRAAIWRLQ